MNFFSSPPTAGRLLFLAAALALLPAEAQLNTPADPVNQRAGLTLVKAASKKTPEELTTLIKSPQFARQLAQWKLNSICSKNELNEISRKGLFLRSLTSDLDWLENFLNSGPIPNPAAALENLALLIKNDSSLTSSPVYKKLATALALEFARNDNPKAEAKNRPWTTEKMLARYKYYKESHKMGLLNPLFDKLDYWDMRIIAGQKVEAWGDVESLTWQRDNVRLPAQDYTGACWQAPYRLHNEWGESIHGPEYYKPFDGIFSGQAEKTKVIGGVCGGLSHFGAFSALANGIPALTMGEPGHCAYTVRINETDWTPAYSLSWERGCHWAFYGQHQWSMLIMTQRAFEKTEEHKLAGRYAWLAQAAAKEDAGAARQFYKKALETNPFDYAVWVDYLDWENAEKSLNREQWGEVSSHICEALGKEFPEIAWMLLKDKVYPVLIPQLVEKKDLMAEIEKIHRSLDKMTPIQWAYPKMLDTQWEWLGKDESATARMAKMLIACHLKSKDYGGPSLSWCQEHIGLNKKMQQAFFAEINGAGGADENALKSLASDIMVAAESAGDIETFQSAATLVKDEFKPTLPSFEPFPGELLSSGGIVKFSSVSKRYGTPWMHWGLLEPCGGHFHTEDDDPATATVTLPRIGDLSGIVIVMKDWGNRHRCDNTIIETSLDGINWTEVAKIDKMQEVNRIDLGEKAPRAAKIRLRRPGKQFYHLNAILIYGKKAS